MVLENLDKYPYIKPSLTTIEMSTEEIIAESGSIDDGKEDTGGFPILPEMEDIGHLWT